MTLTCLPDGLPPTLDAAALRQFLDLQEAAVQAVTQRFYGEHAALYARFGDTGRQACHDDLGFHLEFLRPALEFGLLAPMVDYLRWLDSVLRARAIPSHHLEQSLDWLGDYYRQHMPAPAGLQVAQTLAAARDAFLASLGQHLPDLPRPDAWPQAASFEAALLEGDAQQAQALMLQAMDAGHSLVDVEMHIVQPALYCIGEKWQRNEVSVAQEHLATAIVQALLPVGLLRTPPPPAAGRCVLLACVEGNQHSVGLQMVSDAFSLAGWQVHYLGANVPTRALVSQIAQTRPDLVGLSVSFAQQLRTARLVIKELSAQLGSTRPAVMVGGLAINRFGGASDMLGADASGSNAEAAAALASQMLPPRHG